MQRSTAKYLAYTCLFILNWTSQTSTPYTAAIIKLLSQLIIKAKQKTSKKPITQYIRTSPLILQNSLYFFKISCPTCIPLRTTNIRAFSYSQQNQPCSQPPHPEQQPPHSLSISLSIVEISFAQKKFPSKKLDSVPTPASPPLRKMLLPLNTLARPNFRIAK